MYVCAMTAVSYSILMGIHLSAVGVRNAIRHFGSDSVRHTMLIKEHRDTSLNQEGKQVERHTIQGSSECHTNIHRSSRKG